MLKELAGPLNPEQAKQLGMVQKSARHLLALINDVLDISKIEAGQLEVHLAPFDLPSSIQHVTESVTPLAQKKDITLNVVVPAGLKPVHGDQRRVEQILLNLLNNGIKFTERGSVTVTLEVPAEPTSDASASERWLRVKVADTGVGIETHDLPKLFQPFRQVDSGLKRRYDGTGLGLAICQRLAHLLGGAISVQSTWGQGSVFTVELPMKWISS